MRHDRHTCCERETSQSPTSSSRRGRHALLCPAAIRLPPAIAASMTIAVTTKVARSWRRSLNFQNLARGELKMSLQKLFGALGFLVVGVFAVLPLGPEASAQQSSYAITDLGLR